MASISATILKHHKKQNGTWGVKIRISQKGSSVYLDTSIVANKEDLDTKLRLKKIFIDRFLSIELNRMREEVNALGVKGEVMTAVQLKQYFERNDEVLDLFAFFKEWKNRYQGSAGTILKLSDSMKRLKEFVKADSLSPLDLNVKFLQEFQIFLRIPIRKDAIARGSRSNQTILTTINNVRTIFNAMKDQYNDEDTGQIKIPNDPFRKLVKVKVKPSENRNLSLEQIKSIRDIELNIEADVIARDLFMFSFYMCGINAADIFNSLGKKHGARFNYNRSKTENKRSDNAFMSVKIPDEAKNYIIKYSESLFRRYKTIKSLNNRLSNSLRDIGELLGIERLTFYHARHTFASLARNECRFSKDDVAAALNHSSNTITDVYIAKDWQIVDDVQEGVLALLREKSI